MRIFSALAAAWTLVPPAAKIQPGRTFDPAPQEGVTHSQDVIYGRKFGMALTMDVFAPKQGANRAAVIFVVSGGWVSSPEIIPSALPFSPVPQLLKRGYTVFAVVHASQPKFTIPDILQDMDRAVRYIRSHAADWAIEPGRIGITGGSSGGHLSLMQGTSAAKGDPNANDPVDRASSRVQAVACFFPPTDFLNYGREGVNAIGRGLLKDFKAPFDFVELDHKLGHLGAFVPVTDEKKILQIGRQISPVYRVTAESAPTLVIHGDADKIVPIQQAELMISRLKEAGVPCELIVKQGKGHGWPDLAGDVLAIADWFDKHLK